MHCSGISSGVLRYNAPSIWAYPTPMIPLLWPGPMLPSHTTNCQIAYLRQSLHIQSKRLGLRWKISLRSRLSNDDSHRRSSTARQVSLACVLLLLLLLAFQINTVNGMHPVCRAEGAVSLTACPSNAIISWSVNRLTKQMNHLHPVKPLKRIKLLSNLWCSWVWIYQL